MTNDKNLCTVEGMRKTRENYTSIYTQIINNSKHYKTHAFCFYEGEDRKYYNSRIMKKFSNNYIIYTVGNKKEVLKLLKKLNSDSFYDNLCLMFFIDRDFDESLAEYDEKLFETPCYSIENLYVHEECLGQILQTEFGFNIEDNNYNRCLEDFRLREEEFNEILLEFNALAFLSRQNPYVNNNCSFSSVKTTHLVNIKVNKIEKSSRHYEIIERLKDKLNVSVDEIEHAVSILKRKANYSMDFRGKNQLDFFVAFVMNLKELNCEGGYFSRKINGVSINLTANRLSELSQYARTPEKLEIFLEKHRLKLLEISNQNT